MDRQNESRPKIEYDDVLEEIGETGRYPFMICILICIPIIFSGANIISLAIANETPSYRCLVPECEDPSNTSYHRPWFKENYHSVSGLCFRQKPLNQNIFNEKCPENMFSDDIETCTEWVFDESERTMMSDFQIACESTSQILIIAYTSLIGAAIGYLVFGILADCFGRKLVLIISTLVMSITGILIVLSPNFPLTIVLRFFNNFGYSGIRLLVLMFCIELIGRKNRELAALLPHLFFIVGKVILARISSFCKNWILLQLIVSVPALIFISYNWIIPESARWLLARRKISDAEKVINQAARNNNIELSPVIKESFQQLASSDTTEDKEAGVLRVLTGTSKSPKVVLRFLTILTIWYTHSAAYQNVSRHSFSYLGMDKQTFKIIYSLIFLPGYVFSWICMKTIGRKFTVVSSLIACGVLSFLTYFQSTYEIGWTEKPLYLLNQASYSCVTGVLYLYTAEMLPTTLRCGGVGLASAAHNIGTIYFPVVSLLANISELLPLIAFGCIEIVVGLVAFVFPETRGLTKLPDTAEDAKGI